MHTVLILSVIGVLAATGLSAAPLKIDFAFGSGAYDAVLDDARTAGVAVREFNYGSYGYFGDGLILGNDGLSNRASLIAESGKVFDALTADLGSLTGNITFLSCDGVAPFPDPGLPDVTLRCADSDAIDFAYSTLALLSPPVQLRPDLIIEGYRETGDPVAIAVLTEPATGVLDIASFGDFTNLTRMDVSVTRTGMGGFDWLFDARLNGWLFCGGGTSCGLARVDSVTLDLRGVGSTPGTSTPVPLPAGAGLLAMAVAGLCAVRRVRISAVGSQTG